MTVANLTIGSPTISYTNTLFLSNAGISTPLQVISNLTILPGGALTIFNSALKVDNGTTPTTTDLGSEVEFDGSQVLAVNSTIDTSHAMYTTVGGNIFGGGGTGNLSYDQLHFYAAQLLCRISFQRHGHFFELFQRVWIRTHDGGICAGGWKHVHQWRDMDRHQYLFRPR